ncbi:MAG: hypothetical protein AAGB12_15890, partial [Pseudomonadota bacterium]
MTSLAEDNIVQEKHKLYRLLIQLLVTGFSATVIISFGLIPIMAFTQHFYWLLLCWLVLALTGFGAKHIRYQFSFKQSIKVFYSLIPLSCLLMGVFWGITIGYFFTQVSVDYFPHLFLLAVILLMGYFFILEHYPVFYAIFAIALNLSIAFFVLL